MAVITKGGANAIGSTSDPAWDHSATDASVISLLKAIALSLNA